MVVRTFKMYSVRNFQAYNTVLLTTVIMLYSRALEFIPLITGNVYLFANLISFPPVHSSWQSPVYPALP